MMTTKIISIVIVSIIGHFSFTNNSSTKKYKNA